MTTAVVRMFLAAVQIAGPLLVVLFLADVGLGPADPRGPGAERVRRWASR